MKHQAEPGTKEVLWFPAESNPVCWLPPPRLLLSRPHWAPSLAHLAVQHPSRRRQSLAGLGSDRREILTSYHLPGEQAMGWDRNKHPPDSVLPATTTEAEKPQLGPHNTDLAQEMWAKICWEGSEKGFAFLDGHRLGWHPSSSPFSPLACMCYLKPGCHLAITMGESSRESRTRLLCTTGSPAHMTRESRSPAVKALPVHRGVVLTWACLKMCMMKMVRPRPKM